MMDNFTEASTDLLEIKYNTFYENNSENAVYGILYGKPSKRLATLLNVNREIVIVFSNFTSQQARIVKAVTTAIENGQGRLETTLAIVVIFDKIDYITPESPTGAHWSDQFNVFWRNFRVVYHESSRMKKPFSILVSGVSSKWFRVESINSIENSALALIPE